MNGWKKGMVGMSLLALVGCGGGDADSCAPVGPMPASSETAPALDPFAMTRSASGLYFQDLSVGEGDEAVPGQAVTVHYTGWFVEGEKFDSSVDSGETFSFQLGAGKVIAGWDEGVAGMRIGGKRRLVIPPELAYGASGGQGIPANSSLVFEVELFCVGKG